MSFPKQALVFTCLQYKSFENTVGKAEIARNEQFLLFLQCFLPFQRYLHHFLQIQDCRLQTLSVWKRLKFVGWERVNLTVMTEVFQNFKTLPKDDDKDEACTVVILPMYFSKN